MKKRKPLKQSPYALVYKKFLDAVGEGHRFRELVDRGMLIFCAALDYKEIPVSAGETCRNHPWINEIMRDVRRSLRKSVCRCDSISMTFSPHTYFTVFYPMKSFVRAERDTGIDWILELAQKLHDIFHDEYPRVEQFIRTLVTLAIGTHSDFTHTLFHYEVKTSKDIFTTLINIELQATPAQTRTFTFKGVPRTAYRVAASLGHEGVIWLNLKNDREYPVYIQNHALDALAKRIDVRRKFDLRFSVVNTIIKGEMFRYRGNLLMKYYIEGDLYAGYFLCTEVDDCVCIRTFLFLTNDGTPEGEMFNDKLQIDKNIKSYLGMDKFSTYAEMCRSGELERIFGEKLLEKEEASKEEPL